ncbi:MAG TPA: sigma-70 family RNA polymerase sigma factor [Phycisphaerales bacterium]|nr:sigma-70 family RNA polymerase sigma factor [Phycisphaerales bacterium]HMP36931.1 sigma-70 family RNA polymerase sigma factor [Phycisphaerales bacterium]
MQTPPDRSPSIESSIASSIERRDARSAAELLPVVYDELRRLAESRLRKETPGQTLQPTALVHEAYMRLLGADGDAPRWDSQGHFFAAAAEAMRRILIDRARARGALKRGGGIARQTLDSADLALDDPSAELLEIDEAIERLAKGSRRKADLVRLRFFAGLTMEQAAAVMGVSLATVERDWAFARAWLHRELNPEPEAASGVEPAAADGRAGSARRPDAAPPR